MRLVAAGLLVLAAACAHPPRAARPDVPLGVEMGLASYYATEFQGRRTASGATYDGRALTCAHRTHPFGAVLRVEVIESGRTVDVEVIDRGPFREGRIVDLSREAARRLGLLEQGLARVRVERIR